MTLSTDYPWCVADQSGATVEASTGAVCVSREGHVNSEQLSGSILAGKSEKQRPAGLFHIHWIE